MLGFYEIMGNCSKNYLLKYKTTTREKKDLWIKKNIFIIIITKMRGFDKVSVYCKRDPRECFASGFFFFVGKYN